MICQKRWPIPVIFLILSATLQLRPQAQPTGPAEDQKLETRPEPFGLLELPSSYRSGRATVQKYIQPRETLDLAKISGAGCLRHFWFTFNDSTNSTLLGNSLILRIYYDQNTTPSVEMPISYFFAQFHDQPPGFINSPFLQVTEKGGLNSYFPIPFSSGLRMTLENETDKSWDIYFQGDYHQYNSLPEKLRFHAVYRRENRTRAFGLPYHVGHSRGSGIIAGMALGLRAYDRNDAWYHCGGELILLDGGTSSPSLLGGIGGEDFFGTAYGMETFSNGSIGAAYYLDWTHDKPAREPHVVFSGHRFFQPDHIRFEESFWFDFGSLENDMCSVLYWYQEEPVEPFFAFVPPDKRGADVLIPSGTLDRPTDVPRMWQVAGPFPGADREEFNRIEFPENELNPSRQDPAAFGDYAYAAAEGYPQVMTKWTMQVPSKMHMLDLRPYMRSRLPSNFGMPRNASAYAITTIESPEERDTTIRIGHDDCLKLWVNGEVVYDEGPLQNFRSQEVPVRLRAGENRVMIKNNTTDNFNMRVWVFQFQPMD